MYIDSASICSKASFAFASFSSTTRTVDIKVRSSLTNKGHRKTALKLLLGRVVGDLSHSFESSEPRIGLRLLKKVSVKNLNFGICSEVQLATKLD